MIPLMRHGLSAVMEPPGVEDEETILPHQDPDVELDRCENLSRTSVDPAETMLAFLGRVKNHLMRKELPQARTAFEEAKNLLSAKGDAILPKDYSEILKLYLACAKECLSRKEHLFAQEILQQVSMILLEQEDLPEADVLKAERCKYLALVAIDRGRVGEAEKHFEEGRRACRSHESLSLAYIDFLRSQNDLRGAVRICSAVLKEVPEPSDAFLYERTKLHAELGEVQAAIHDGRSFLDIRGIDRSRRVEILDLLSESCRKIHDYAMASFYMKQACQIDFEIRRSVLRSRDLLEVTLTAKLPEVLPEDWMKKRLHGALALAKERPSEALPILEEALEDPEMLELHILAGVRLSYAEALFAMDDVGAAEEAAKEVARLPLNDFWLIELYAFQAALYMQRERFDEAEQHFREGWRLCLKPSNFEKRALFAQNFLAFLTDTRKDFAQALQLCGEVGTQAESLEQQIHVYRAMGNNSLVRGACDRWLQKRQGDLRKQLEILSIAAEASEELPEVHYLYLLKAYDLETSPEHRAQFIKLNQMYEQLKGKSPQLRAPAPKEFERISHRACAEKNPENVLKLLEPMSVEALNFPEFLARAKAYIQSGSLEHLALAQRDLDQALLVFPRPNRWKFQEYKKWCQQQSLVYLQLAELCIKQAKFKEAREHFEQGWKLSKTFEFAKSYVKFLEPEKALKFCEEAQKLEIFRPFHFHYYRAKIYFQARLWGGAMVECEGFLNLQDYKKETKRFEIYEILIQSAMHLEHFSIAKKYALQAYLHENDPAYFLQRINRVQAAFQEIYVEKHLEHLLSQFRENRSLQPSQKIAYLSLLLDMYEIELQVHRRRKAEILHLRGELYLGRGEIEKAQTDRTQADELLT